MIGRRAALGGSAAAALARPARAGRPLVLVVGASPGANADIVARSFAPFLERHLPDRQVAIRNVPGEVGMTAYRALAEAPPNGEVLGWAATPSLPARTVDHAGASLMTRIRLLGAVQREPVAFVSAAATPLASTAELLERSSIRLAAVPLGTPPAGSPAHLAALQLQAAAGTPLNIVTFPSAAAARQAALAGNLAAAALDLGDALGALRDGRLAQLGPASGSSDSAAAESHPLNGGAPPPVTIRRGLAAPAGLRQEEATMVCDALQAVVSDPEFTAQATQSGFTVDWETGPDWTAIAEAERAALSSLWRAGAWAPTGSG